VIRPILITFYLHSITFFDKQPAEHHNQLYFVLPNHCSEIVDRSFSRSLCCDKHIFGIFSNAFYEICVDICIVEFIFCGFLRIQLNFWVVNLRFKYFMGVNNVTGNEW